MFIWSEFRMGQYRDDDHREDAPQFIDTTTIDECHFISVFISFAIEKVTF